MLRNLWLNSIVTVLILLGTASARAGTRMTPELLWKLGRLGDVAASRDGQYIAYVVRRYDLKANDGTSSIHIIATHTRKDRILVGNLDSAACLQFVAGKNGLRLYYVGGPKKPQPENGGEDREQRRPKAQVWSVPASGGTPLQVTHIKRGVANLRVAPTGTRLAFTVRVKLDPTVNEIYKDLPKAKARIIDHLMYRHWNTWFDYSYNHIHIAALDKDGRAAKPVDLMQGIRANCPLEPFGGVEQYAWSPDGREIAYTAKIVNDSAESTDSDIYLVDISGRQPTRCITAGMDGYDMNPTYSPNGMYIAFQSMKRAGFESDRDRIMLFDRAAGSIRELTKGLDQDTHHVAWMPDSASLVFMSEHRGTDQLFQIQVRDGTVSQLTRGWFNWDIGTVIGDGAQLLVKRQSMLRPKELFLLRVADGDARPVTHINDGTYKNLELPTVKQRWIRSSDGAHVQCWVVYPPDFDPHKKWPMLTYCQGGPQGQIGQWFSYRWNFHLMAARGYVVLAPNRRGLPGFGRAWNDEISGDWGGQAMQDILAATDAMMVEPYIDTRHMAAIGASFGGYTVYWLMGHSRDRFCCMVAHAGVFDLESMYGSTEELWFPNWDLGGPYWKSARIQRKYDQFSPNRFVGNWRTPLLVIHGEKDFRVPVTQGMEAFTAAKVQGIPARFLYFPTECHWVLKPQNGVLWHRVFFEWLDRWCRPSK